MDPTIDDIRKLLEARRMELLDEFDRTTAEASRQIGICQGRLAELDGIIASIEKTYGPGGGEQGMDPAAPQRDKPNAI